MTQFSPRVLFSTFFVRYRDCSAWRLQAATLAGWHFWQEDTIPPEPSKYADFSLCVRLEGNVTDPAKSWDDRFCSEDFFPFICEQETGNHRTLPRHHCFVH